MKKILTILLLCSTCYAQQLPFLTADGKWLGLYVAPPFTGMQYPAFETVKMTANNLPNPVVSSSDSETFGAAWQAYDRVSASSWSTAGPNDTPYFNQYDLGLNNSAAVSRLYVNFYIADNRIASNFNVMASMNGTNYTTLLTSTFANTGKQSILLSNTEYYRFYKLNLLSYYRLNWYHTVYDIEWSSADFDGAIATASNAPNPYIFSADAEDASQNAWKAFDRDNITYWQSSAGFPHFLKINYGSNVVINGFVYRIYGQGYGFKDYVFAGSTDDNTYKTLTTGQFANVTDTYILVTNNNTTAYQYYKLSATNGWGAITTCYEWTPKHYK